jgi:hypothetical protein
MQRYSSNRSVFFYVPAHLWPEDLPLGADYFWSANRGGMWNWTFQTYEHLKRLGFPCSLVTELPSAGIIIAHRKLFPLSLRPTARQLIVCIEADRGRMPFAQLHIQQNAVGASLANSSWLGRLDQRLLKQSTNHFIYYWPQPGLIPRDGSRGDQFKNVVFMGRERHLIDELKSDDFKREVDKLGLRFLPQFSKDRWGDYSEADCVVAIRDLKGFKHINKPATKLYNAWHAGVPVILNPESAYLAASDLDSSGAPLDFIPARSAEDVIDALRRLSASKDLRETLVARGRRKAAETSPDRITHGWVEYLENSALPMYERWATMSEHRRRVFFMFRELHFGYHKRKRAILSVWKKKVGLGTGEPRRCFESD